MKKVLSVLLVISFFFVGCSAHNVSIIRDTTDIYPLSKSEKPHSRKVFLTSMSLPFHVEYKELGRIECGKASYGSPEDIYIMLASAARNLGADGIINVNTWMQQSGLALVAPHGSGIAIKIIKPKNYNMLGINVFWR